ncbi:ferritin family protein [Sporomusa sp. KB1]|jgi:rubrerythrin|uniref:ferritin family protein n=1 Tax=Sporomusa sp. KB1 TaxID=943346 RepID=UPI0011AA7CF1|nr:ferritin family protein [Sporomusa sp. KB1]TWH51816.1 rubrerythrin [Sporomusa sp. KB1]
MENLLSDLEGLRIAMNIEKRGFNFYQKAYNKFNDTQAKALFKILMEEEQEHLSTFTEYFNRIEACKEAHSAEYLFDAETSKYLTVLVESHVFPTEQDAERIINELATVGNIIKLALGAEKDSILLYDELAKCSKFEDAKTVFLKLKGEEQRHVTEISHKLKQIVNA